MSKGINKAAKVRMMLRRNPNIKASAVVEILDCTMQQAHVMLNTQRKKLHIFKRKDGVYVGKTPMESSVIKTPAEAGSLDKVPSIVEEHFPITMQADPVNHPEHYKVGGSNSLSQRASTIKQKIFGF